MTIREAITEVDKGLFNAYTTSEKVRWLSRLDGEIYNTIVSVREGAPDSFEPYTDSDDTVLLVPHPYEDVYITYLQAMIHYSNGETVRYNNAIAMHNATLDSFRNHYNNTHRHLGGGLKLL